MNELERTSDIYFLDENAMVNYQRIKSAAEHFVGYTIPNGSLSVLAVYGALGKGYWDFCFSFYQEIQDNIEQLLNDEEVKEIVLLLDSPGGVCTGLFSCCDYIRKAKERKPIHAFISGEACSAAYAIATSCTDVTIEEDSETGCCGAFARAMEYDPAFLEKKEGILSRIFRSKNAPKKNLSPITNEEAAKALQERIDELGNEYMSYIAENRGLSIEECEENFGQGAVVSAKYALENKMVDAISDWDSFIENIKSSLSADEDKSEGADMDIVNMSAEDRAEAFKALVEADPTLLASATEEAGKAERERVMALTSLKNGVAEYDEIINKAIEEGRCANETKIALFDYMEAHPIEKKAETPVNAEAIEALAEADQPVNPANSESDEFSLLMKKVEEARK